MSIEFQLLFVLNPILLVVVGWLIRNWVNDVKATLQLLSTRVGKLESKVAFLEGKAASHHD